MAPIPSYGGARGTGVGRATAAPVDEQRLDPKLERFTSGAAPAALPSYLLLGLPICFMIALGIILVGFHGALTPESLVFFGLGILGLFFVRYLNRQS